MIKNKGKQNCISVIVSNTMNVHKFQLYFAEQTLLLYRSICEKNEQFRTKSMRDFRVNKTQLETTNHKAQQRHRQRQHEKEAGHVE